MLRSRYDDLSALDISVCVGESRITPSSSVRNLGALIDSTFNLDSHVNVLCRSAYYHVRRIGLIRKYLTQSATAQLVHLPLCYRV